MMSIHRAVRLFAALRRALLIVLVAAALLPLPPAVSPAAAQAVTAPGAPSGLSATAGNAKLALSWTAPADDGGSAVTGYTVQWKSGAETFATAAADGRQATLVGTATAYDITGLTNSTAYTVRVAAVNPVGTGTWSTEATGTPAAQAPGAPTGVQLVPGQSKITVSWTAPADNGGSAVTGYKVQWREKAQSYDSTRQATPTASPHEITGLTNNTQYYVQVAATNSVGDSSYTTETYTYPGQSLPTSADTVRKVNGSGFTNIPVSKFPFSDADNHQFIFLQVVTLPDAAQGTLKTKRSHRLHRNKPAADVTVGQKLYNEKYMSRLNQYVLRFYPKSGFTETSFTFKVIDSKGQASSATYTATLSLQASGTPATPTATAGNGEVTLAWQPLTTMTVHGWEYQYKVGTGTYGSWTEVPNSSASTTSVTVGSLTNGTAHTFRIRAFNALKNCTASSSDGDGCTPADGYSSTSAEVAATPAVPSSPPSGVTASAGPGAQQITMSWQNPYDSTVTGYKYRIVQATNAYDSVLDSCGAYPAIDSSTAKVDISSSGANTTWHIIDVANSTHCYKLDVIAVRGAAEADSSDVDDIRAYAADQTPSFGTPGAPHNLRATAGDTQVLLQWDDPHVHSSAITGYEYQVKIGAGTYGAWQDVSGSNDDTTAVTVASLTNGTQHSFKVRAVYGTTDGTASAEVSATPTAAATAPAAPTSVTAVAGDRKVRLSWTAPSGSVTTFQYQQKIGAGNYGLWQDVPGGSTVGQYLISGLANGTVHSYKVRAKNSAGDGTASAEITATPVAPPVAPVLCDDEETTDDDGDSSVRHASCGTGASNGSATSGLTMTARWVQMSDSQITKWQARIKQVSPLCVNPKDASTTYPCAWGAWSDIDDSALTATSSTATLHTSAKDYLTGNADVDYGRSYQVQLRAATPLESGASSNVIRLAMTPANLSGFAAAPGDGKIKLSWSDPGDPSITGYEMSISRYAGPGNSPAAKTYADTAIGSATSTSHTLTTLPDANAVTNGHRYRVAVRAKNKWGQLAFTGHLDVTPSATAAAAPAAPAGLSATGGSQQIALSWTDPNDEYITKYQVRYSSGSISSATWADIASSSASTTSHTITGLTVNTGYTVEIRAVNNSSTNTDRPGTAAQATATTHPNVPAAPDRLVVQAASASATLGWIDANDSTITHWQIRQRNNSGSWGDWRGPYTPSTSSCYTWSSHFNRWQTNSSLSTTCGFYTSKHPFPGGGQTPALKVRILSLTGRPEGHPSLYQVRAVNAGGNGPASSSWDITQWFLFASVSSGTVNLSWTTPTPSYHGAEKWQFRYKTANGGTFGSWADVPSSTGSTRSHTVSTLTDGTAYTFEVRPYAGVGGLVRSVNATPVATPVAPATLSATPSGRDVSLAWTLATADSSITKWQYRYKAGSGNYGSWADVGSSSAATRSATASDLDSGSTYTFQVRAVNGAGDGASATSAATAALAAEAPSGLTAVRGSTAGTAVLTWTDPKDSGISKYQVRYKTTGSFTSWADIASSSASTATTTVTGLTGDNSYTFQVRALSGASGTVIGAASADALTPPAAPSGLSAVGAHRRVILSWTAQGDASVTGWEYREREKNGVGKAGVWSHWTAMASSSAATTTFTHHADGSTNVMNGTEYEFQIRAVNGGGDGPASSTVSATPTAPPGKPTGLSAAAGSSVGSVALTWTDPSDSSIGKYEYRWKESTAADYGSWTEVPSSGAATTSYSVGSLTYPKQYSFQIRAHNAYDASAASAAVTGVPKPPVPAAPSGLTAAVSGIGTVQLSWTALGNASVTSFETSHKLSTAANFGSWSAVSSSGSATTTAQITGLTGGSQYTFRVRAVNGTGDGAASAEVTATPSSQPAAPANLTATAVSTEVTLTWDKPSNHSSITRYEVATKSGGSYGAWTGVGTGTVSGTSPNEKVSVKRTGLTNGTAYAFKVRAVITGVGNGAASAEASATPEAPPAAPTGVSATPADTSLLLSWTDPSDADITSYETRYYVLATKSWTGWAEVSGSGAATTAATVTGLTNGTSYWVQLRAVSAMGDGTATNVTATPYPVPAAPTAITATARNGSVNLSWTAASNTTITKWQRSHKLASAMTWGAWTDICETFAADPDDNDPTCPGARSAKVPTLTNGSSYSFRVRAVNAAGDGAVSATATATPVAPPAAPAGLTATSLSGGRVRLSWTDPSNDSISAYHYRYRTSGGIYPLDSEKNPVWTAVPSSDSDTTSVTVPSLDGDKTYAFQVRATNSAGDGAASAEASATAYAGPAGPTALSATEGDATATLAWTAATNSGILRWQYRFRTVSSWSGIGWSDVPSSSASTRSATISHLANGTQYVFQVRSADAQGGGVPSPEATVTPIAPPKAPGKVAVALAAGSTATTFNWTASWVNTEGRVVTTWEYRTRSTGGSWGSWTAMASADVSQSGSDYSYERSGQSRNSINAVQLRARNSVGDSPASSTVSLAVAKPTGLSATPKHASADLSWTALGDTTVQKWQVRYKATSASNYGSWADVASSSAATAAAVVSGLTNSTGYSFQVRAATHALDGPASDAATATPKAKPAKPSGLSAVGKAARAELSWTALGDTSVSKWQVRHKQSSASDYGDWADVASSGAATTTATVGSLTDGTEYSFQVRAVNAYGESDPSDAVTATPEAVPAAPTGLSATGGDQQISLSWTDPGDDTIDKWQYRSRRSGGAYGSWADVASSDADTTSATVSSLDNGKVYDVELRAWNNNGGGPASAVTGIGTKLVAPTGVSATPSNASATLRWNDPSNSSITGYKYQYKSGGGTYGSWTAVQNATATTTSVSVASLTNDTIYTFKVRAVNAVGDGPESAEFTAIPNDGSVPAAPAGLSATGGSQQISLSWTNPSDITISSWETRHREADGTWGSWATVSSSDKDTTSATISGLTNGKAYDVGVRAVNMNGNGAASALSDVGTDLVAPSGLSAAAGDQSVSLTWTAPSNASISGYKYRYKAGQGSFGSWTAVQNATATTTSATVSGLTNMTAHTFELRAVNNTGDGPASSQVSATPVPDSAPAAPVGLSASGGNAQVALSWTDPNDPSITKWHYRYRIADGTWSSWADIANSDEDTDSFTKTGLDNGKAYDFAVRARNLRGDGTAATISDVGTQLVAPSGLSAAAGDTQATLSWTDPSNTSISGYKYQYKVCPADTVGTCSGSFGSWQSVSSAGATTTSATVSSLTNDREHHFKLRAVNAVGDGPATALVRVIPNDGTVPAAPAGLSATGGNQQIALSWTDPNDVTISSWEVRHRVADGTWGSWSTVSSSDKDTTSATISGLTNGKAYDVGLRAVNMNGNGSASSLSDVGTSLVAPSGLSAAAGDTEVTLSWTDPSNSSISGYKYRHKAGQGSFGSWTAVQNASDSTTSATVDGLTNMTAYTFELRAVNNTGDGPASSQVSATPVPDNAPAAPAGFTATGGNAQVALAWTDPDDPSITKYQVRHRISGGTWGDWEDISDSDEDTASHTVTGLTNGRAYDVAVRGWNLRGAGAAASAATVGTQLVAPAGFTATGGNQQATLAWTSASNGSITDWQYRYKTAAQSDFPTSGAGSWTSVQNASATTTSATVSTLTNLTSYTFELRAVNPVGDGPAAQAVGVPAASVPAAPTGLAAATSGASVTLNWTDPQNVSITGYQYQYKAGSGNYGSWQTVSGATAATTSVSVPLSTATAYTLKVRALNGLGSSSASSEVSARTVPSAPRYLGATPYDASAALAWLADEDSYITGWQVQHRTTGEWSSWRSLSLSKSNTSGGIMTLWATATALANGTSHQLRVRSQSAVGPSSPSNTVSATPLAVPAAPTGLSAGGGDNQASLRWADPSNATIDKYAYTYRRSGGNWASWSEMSASGASTTTYTVTGLENGELYEFQVRAHNASGWGSASAKASAQMVPAAPSGLSATPRHGKVILAWTALGDATVEGFQYRYRTGSSWTTESWNDVSSSDDETVTATVPSLTNGTTYTFAVRAVNDTGSGDSSADVSIAPVARPAAPGGLAATGGDAQVALSWTDPSNSTINDWQYRYKKGNGSWGGWTAIDDSSAATTSVTVTGLDNGAAYTLAVRARNDSGDGAVSTVTADTVPATPTGVTAAGAGATVTLRWTNAGDDTITKWQERHKTSGGTFGSWNDVCVSSSDSACPARRSAAVASLNLATGYVFEVRGVNASGNGNASAQATARTGAAKPTNLDATPKNTRVTLSWDDPSNSDITAWAYQWKLADETDWTGCTPSSNCGSGSIANSSNAVVTTGDVTGLTNDTAYDLRIMARSPHGDSAWSDAASATPIDKPDQVANLAAVITDGQAALSWTALGDTSVTKWQYRLKKTGEQFPADWTDVANSSASTTSAAVTGLDNGTTYTIQLRAFNNEGGTAASVTALMLPAAPASLTAIGRYQSVDLAWDDPSNGSITRYEYRYKSDGGYGSWTPAPSSGATTTGYRVPGLTNGTGYTLQVRAVNATGNGLRSAEVSATPLDYVAEPTGLAVTFRNATASAYQWSLGWTAHTDTSITKWQLRTSDGDGQWGAWGDIADSQQSTTSYTSLPTWLANDITSVQIRAVNNAGAGAASDALRLLPAQPQGLSATRVVGAYAADLSWTALGDSSVDSWQFRRKTPLTAWTNWSTLSGLTDASTGYSNLALSATATIFLQIRAVNEAGAGPASAQAAVALTPVKPTGFSATRCDTTTNAPCDTTSDDRKVGLAWGLPAADTSITRWHYRSRIQGQSWPQDCTGDTPPVCTDFWRTVPKPANKQHHELRSQLVSSGLRWGNTYEFQVRAANAAGPGPVSDTRNVVMRPARPPSIDATNVKLNGSELSLSWAGAAGAAQYQYRYDAIGLTGPPPKPANFSAAARNAAVALSWDDASTQLISRYDVRHKVTSAASWGPWTPIPQSSASTVSHTVTGLTNGTEYSFQVRAVRPGSPGVPSDEAKATPDSSSGSSQRYTAPAGAQPQANASPGGAAATGLGRDAAAVSGAGAGSTANAQQNCPAEATWHNVTVGTAVDVTCLTPGTQYSMQVRATMSGGSDPGEPSGLVLAVPAKAPAKPTGLSASPLAAAAELSWDPGTDPGGQPITGWSYRYKIKKIDGTYEDWRPWTPVDGADELTVSTRVTGLPHKGVAFQVRAVNAIGNSEASDESAEIVPLEVARARGPVGGAPSGGGGGVVASSRASSLRLGGSDRYATAVKAAQQYVEEIAAAAFVRSAIVVSGENFPDALAASSLSGRLTAPVLLVPRDRLPGEVRSFLERHQISDVRIVGGPAAVSDAVKAAIEALVAVEQVTRIAGADRFATAAAVADVVGTPGAMCGFPRRTVIVASGTSWPDAVVAGPIAYRGGHPVLLTSKGSLPAATRAYLASFKASHVLLLGGTAVVSEAVERQMTGLGLFVTRVAGKDRYSTAAALATYLAQRRSGASAGSSCLGDDTVGLVTGTSFPDALAAAPLMGWYGAPVLLTPRDALPPSVIEYITSRWYQPADDVVEVVVIGGRAVVPSALLHAFAQARE